MKRLRSLAVAAMFALTAYAQIVPAAKITPDPTLHAPRPALANLELLLDTRLFALGTANDPVDMLGRTRGIYLPNYGAVFTSEISLIITPTVSPFRLTITKEMHDQVHQRKIARIPALRAAMTEMIRQAAGQLPQVPENQQIVVAVRLKYVSWEDRTGLPSQLMVSATRKDALNGVVQATEEQ